MKKNQKRTPQKDQSVRLEFTFSPERYERLKTAQSLMSHIVKDGDLAEAFDFLAKLYTKQKRREN